MALMQQLTNQGRVVGGHLTNGTVTAASNALVVQKAFKRQKLTSETVESWQEIATEGGTAGVVGQAVARAALPGVVGKAVGAGLGAAMHRGHTVRVDWVDGQQSLMELPEKLYVVFSVLLADRRQAVLDQVTLEADGPAPGASGRLSEQVFQFASSVVQSRRHEATATTAEPDVTEQLTKLGALRDQGILTEEEFAAKKLELLKRL